MTFIKFREDARGAHVYVTVFVGVDEGHLANAGDLVFRVAEWAELRLAIESIGEIRRVIAGMKVTDDA